MPCLLGLLRTERNAIMHSIVRVNYAVFLDTISGLVPATVTGYSSDGQVTVKVTETVRAYQEGESLAFQPRSVVPRSHVRTRGHSMRIVGSWEFEGLAPEFQPKWA